MSHLTTWYDTELPNEMIDLMIRDLQKFDSEMKDSLCLGHDETDPVRNSQNTWITTSHWIGGFIWHYVQRTNRENFLYDLTCIDAESLQYTQYGTGQYYDWHIDAGINSTYKPELTPAQTINTGQDFVRLQGEYIRKLSFTIQLSGPDDYTGGEIQFMNNSRKLYTAPKNRGTIIFFDSRTPHRVRKVKSGVRKSIVGWVVGPRWK